MSAISSIKKFDLNIGEILEHWSLPLAIREIIANAIDETALSKCKQDMVIEKGQDQKDQKEDSDMVTYIIRDYGRGIRYENLVQDESAEKLKNTKVIGKFGFGLKDAIATFVRHGIKFDIKSKHNSITVAKSAKHNFDEIKTLHAFVDSNVDKDFIGTEFILYNVKNRDMDDAKKFFLKYNDLPLLEETQYGEIYECKKGKAMIFINGIKISEEPNFLFHYNITSLTKVMRKSLNRERTNVGRTVYATRIKDILQKATDEKVISSLIDDIIKINKGTNHDEILYEPVKIYAIRHQNTHGNCIFLTQEELIANPDIMNDCNNRGKKMVIISNKTIKGLMKKTDMMGNPINTISQFKNGMIIPKGIIDTKSLEGKKLENFQMTEKILETAGFKQRFSLFIVEKFETKYSFSIAGLCQGENIYILISELSNLTRYAGTLIHEYIHATTHTVDSTRDFEEHLTEMIGNLSKKLIEANF